MISLVIWTGRQRRSIILRRHRRWWCHRRLGRQARLLITPFGDYHFGRTFTNRYQVRVRRTGPRGRS